MLNRLTRPNWHAACSLSQHVRAYTPVNTVARRAYPLWCCSDTFCSKYVWASAQNRATAPIQSRILHCTAPRRTKLDPMSPASSEWPNWSIDPKFTCVWRCASFLWNQTIRVAFVVVVVVFVLVDDDVFCLYPKLKTKWPSSGLSVNSFTLDS